MVDWTDELRLEVVEAYKKAEPTPENSMDIVKKIAEDIEVTSNGVRGILSKAGVYIKKAAASSSGGSSDKPKSTRVNKADAQDKLVKLIESLGKEADMDIIGKLTGKAALYLEDVFKQ